MSVAIEAERLVKRYGEQVVLDELSFAVQEGSVLGVLGPNGAGKTTAVQAVTGLCRLDSGEARILGRSVLRDGATVKQLTGFSGQFAAVDEDLTTEENLVLVGRLSGHPQRLSRRRAEELVQAFDLSDVARKRVGRHSGGMRRRVDLACALVAHPRVLVLDEPTTGLDPTSRHSLWSMIQGLVAEGMTLLLTTQYLEEADALADRILVMTQGREVAQGTPSELKEQLGGDRVRVQLTRQKDTARAVQAVQPLLAGAEPEHDAALGHLVFRAPNAARAIAPGVRALADAGVSIEGISVEHLTLDDVFFALTEAPPQKRRATTSLRGTGART